MTTQDARSLISRTRVKYLALRFTETVITALAALLLCASFLYILRVEFQITSIISAGIGIAVFGLRSFQLGLYRFHETSIANFLNEQYTELEESSDLILQNEGQLSMLQKIQKERTAERLGAMSSSLLLPHRIGFSFGILVIGILFYFAVQVFDLRIPMQKPLPNGDKNMAVENTAIQHRKISVASARVALEPPVYTSLPRTNKEDLNLIVPEDSKITWSIKFTEPPLMAWLNFSDKDSLVLSSDKNHDYSARRTFSEKGFYQILWKDEKGKTKSSDFYRVELIKDQPPKIVVEDIPQFAEYTYEKGLTVSFNTSLSDDYGLRDADIIATVSKGSGESVKFREEKLRFDSPEVISGKRIKCRRTIDFTKLGMEPGDELYFYVQAVDNKIPQSNGSRTETWFIALRDTATNSATVDSGMGVDLMPEYFRSQRQIIIDTEKLLDEEAKKKVTKSDFNFRSNELGYDQKVLRLRYGQFLGEEFETSVAPVATGEDEENVETEEDVKAKYGHVHDKENEHNLVKEKADPKDEHVGEHAEGEEKENPLEAFAHQHDKGDEATFFVQSVKTKLKAALTLMWDAELHLRLYEPAKSLPYQYRILKLLKEISNDSRVYVHRNGFDPPPLKEDKRMTADLSEIMNASVLYTADRTEKYPAIRESLEIINHLSQRDSSKITPAQQSVFQLAGNELSEIAIERPGEFLKALSVLKSVINNESLPQDFKANLTEIQAAFWKALPNETPAPVRNQRSIHSLDKAFIKNLN